VNRATAIYTILRRIGPDTARREVLGALETTSGNLRRGAFVLGLSRRQFYRLVYRFDLWPEVAQFRRLRYAASKERQALRRQQLQELPPCT